MGPRHANSISQNHHVGGYGFVWDPEGGRQETSKGWYFVNDSGEHAGSFAPAEYADALSDDRWIVGSATRRGENWAVVLVPTFD
ncbi:MAG: hypothetical protein RBU37_02735 [Myxococcota bacterium]|nr:hypothetical protein [Myxococcota bacterium]